MLYLHSTVVEVPCRYDSPSFRQHIWNNLRHMNCCSRLHTYQHHTFMALAKRRNWWTSFPLLLGVSFRPFVNDNRLHRVGGAACYTILYNVHNSIEIILKQISPNRNRTTTSLWTFREAMAESWRLTIKTSFTNVSDDLMNDNYSLLFSHKPWKQ